MDDKDDDKVLQRRILKLKADELKAEVKEAEKELLDKLLVVFAPSSDRRFLVEISSILLIIIILAVAFTFLILRT